MANQDKKEINRELSDAEKKRLDSFNAKSEALLKQGYQRTDLTVGIIFANIFAMILFIPLILVFGGLFLFVNQKRLHYDFGPGFLITMIAYFAAIVLHEAIHGWTWGAFAPHGMKDIEFGFMKEYLTPYATCLEPLAKIPYILGAAMPLIALGIIPCLVSVILNSPYLLFFGIMMSASAGGDILVVCQVLKTRNRTEDPLYMDHPTQAGVVLFEKEN